MKHFNTTKYKISILVVMVMLLQVLLPAMGDVVWAEESVEGFKIIKEEIGKDGMAHIYWEFELDPENKVEIKPIKLGFTLEAKEDGNLEVLEADDKAKTVIGTYSISEEGIMTVEIDKSLYNAEEGYQGDIGETDTGFEENEVDGTEELEIPKKDEETERNEESEVQDGNEEPNKLEEGEKEHLDENKEDIDVGQEYDKNNEIEKTKTYQGTIIVNGIIEDEVEEVEEKDGFVLKLFEVTDLNDNPYTEDNPLDPKDEFKLKLEWNLRDGHNYKAGDTVTFDLPQGIKIQEGIPVELKDSSGKIVANAVVTTDNKVELTFTDFVETHSNVTGWMEIISEIDEKNAEIEDGEIVLKPITDEGEIRIPINLGNREKTIEKKGKPNKSYNADKINWEVIINKHKIDLKDAKVEDILPEGTEYKAGSLKVTKLKVDLNGNILGDDPEEVEDITPTVGKVEVEGKDRSQLIIPLGDIKDAYRIEYVTTVTDDDQKTFKNNVTLKDKDLDDISADATVTVNRGEPIKKSAVTGYNPKTGIIEWEIEFNFNQKNLENVTLTDEWTPKGKMELVEGSLRFQEVTIDENGKPQNVGDPIVLPNGATLVKGEDQFEVTGITTDKAYIITYQTKVKERVLEGFTISNTAGFGNESSNSGKYVGTYYGSKSAGTVDYKNKTIEWKIEINHDEYPMEKISVKDTLGKGLTLDKETIKITVDNKPYDVEKEGNYTVADGNPFTINFPENFKTDKKIVITYKTNFVADEVPNNKATNKAEITWTPKGETEPISKEVNAETLLNKGTEDNSWKNGSYNPATKEITWTIIVNYRENKINNLIIEDKPQGNQEIIDGSAVVKELEIAIGGKINEVRTLDNVSTIDVDNNTLKVNIGNTNKAYKIEYKTSIADLSDIQKEYINKATVHDGDKKLSELEAKVGIAKAHTYGAKSGKQDGKQVHWSVTVNPGQQKVTNLKLEDTVSENQEILTDTFKVYEASVDRDGNATKGNEYNSSKYELTHEEGESTFTVKWKHTVERAFIVEYSTLFFEKHYGEVTNRYKVTGDNIVEGGKTDGDGKVIISQRGSGGGSGEVGYLVINKVDTTYGQEKTKLTGAEFDLIDADTNKVLKSGITDENGEIDFGRLLYGEYKLKETKVPGGYVAPKEEQTITINQKYTPEADKTTFEYEVENYRPVFAIELLKTGKDNKALTGAEFTLYDSDNNELKTATTNADGKILFKDLNKAGTYYIKETKAPEGYELKDKKYEVTIGEKEKEPVKVSIANNVLVGKTSISGEKTWKDEDSIERSKYIKVKLTRKVGEVIDRFFSEIKTVEPNSEGKWVYEFENLDKYDENGLEYEYMVEEIDVPENYKPIVDGHNIANVRIGKTEVSGIKIWKDDKESDRPDLIKVNLLRNGVVIETQQVTAKDGWEYSFTDLDKYDEEGKLYIYTIAEQDVAGYASQVEGYNITNTRSEKKSIEITKGWLDDNLKERPDLVTVFLYQNNKLSDTVEIKADNDWIYKFDDLEAYDENGKAYSYTVKEEPVNGYETTVNGFNITNLRVGKTEVTGTKIWKGGSSPKPTIELQLYRNGAKLGAPVELKDGETTYTWTELDKFDESGKEYKYTIDEVKVPNNYRKSISEDGLTITNRYRPPTPPGPGPGGPTDPEEPTDPEKPKEEDPDEPEEPTDPEKPVDPEQPTEPTEPTDPTDPEDPLIDLDGKTPGDGTDVDKEDEDDPTIGLDGNTPKGGTGVDKPTLPKTGENNNIFFYFIGLALIALGFVFRRKTV